MSHNQDKLSVGLSQSITEQSLNNKLANLTDEITPERDLWSGIERAISQKSQESTNNQAKLSVVPMAWAASFIAAILVSWLTFMPQTQENAQQELSASLDVNPAANLAANSKANSEVTEQLVTFMQENFKQQKEAMLVSFGQPNLSQLPETMQKELQQLATARKSIRQALLKDENNVDLLHLLDFTQQQELKLLAQLYRQYQVI